MCRLAYAIVMRGHPLDRLLLQDEKAFGKHMEAAYLCVKATTMHFASSRLVTDAVRGTSTNTPTHSSISAMVWYIGRLHVLQTSPLPCPASTTLKETTKHE